MYKLVAVTNRFACKMDFLKQIEILAKSPIDSIILREKDLSSEEYGKLAEQVIEICNTYQTECILHSFIDVAKTLKQTKIHLPLGLALKQKDELNHFQEIGCSIHSLEDVQKVEVLQKQMITSREQSIYLTAGHIFKTDCKKGVPPRGLVFLKEICENTDLPVYAIGGIEPKNAHFALEQGAKGVCLMSWCMCATPKEIIELKENIHL